jgi:hypothetical protein
MIEDKEKIYDEQIFPLMERILAVVKEHKIPFFTTFQCSDDTFCTSELIPQEDSHIILEFLDALYQCREGNGVNIDKFVFWIIKRVRGQEHSSLVLNQLLREKEDER